jgi:acyl-coenzyme A thioesterase PaaI-like protein
MHSFDRAIGLTSDGEQLRATLNKEWWVGDAGPWGGYVSALLAAAIVRTVPELPLISLTVHLLRRLNEGDATVVVDVESMGSRLAHVSARVVQGDDSGAVALATLGVNPQDDFVSDLGMPQADPPDEVERRNESSHPYMQHFDIRPTVLVKPWSGRNEGTLAGWVNMVEPRALDVPLLAALPDAWMPGTWARLTEPAGKVTMNLSINFRSAITEGDLGPWFVRVRSRHIERGFNDEDCEVWGSDGRLLAQSRQMVLLSRRK